MILGVGLQFLSVAALACALLLVACTFYVRLRQSTFTEKRFNFFALWSCLAVVTMALSLIFNIPLIEAVLVQAGISIQPPDPWAKTLAALIAVSYVGKVSMWARSWNGRLSEDGHCAGKQSIPAFFVIDGAKETLRILKRKPLSPVRPDKSVEPPKLPRPLPELPFREQVRELMVGWWPELIVDDDAWIGSGSCWRGLDTSLNQPVLVVCGADESEVDLSRIRALVVYLGEQDTRLIAVFEAFRNREGFKACLDQLSRTAKVLTFDELVVEAVPIGRYKREIEQYFRKNPLPGADFPVADVLVPARAYKGLAAEPQITHSNRAPFDLERHVSNWISEDSLRQLALLGTYGQGKSTAALALTHKLLFDPDFAERCNNRIPLLIRLTGLSPKTSNPEALLGQWGSRLGLNGRALLALHRAGQTVLILDAFDEMANVADRADRFDHFASLWQFACQGSKVLFTGRPNFFLDDEELKRALGISEGVAVGPYCAALRLAPFKEDQIAQALRWMPPAKVGIFLHTLDKLPQLLEIARRPSLLFQVSQLWHIGRLDIEGGNIYSGIIIRQFVTYSLERQIQKQRTDKEFGRHDRQFIPITLAELDYFTCGCAVAALSEGRNNSLPVPVLRSTVSRLLDALARQALPLSLGEGGALAMPLNERLADRPDPVEAVVQAVRTHGVIEHDPSKAGFYIFSHKSFAEALTAELLTHTAVGIKHTPKILDRSVINDVCRQDAILLFSAEVAAAEAFLAKDTAVSAMLSNIMSTNRLVATIFFLPEFGASIARTIGTAVILKFFAYISIVLVVVVSLSLVIGHRIVIWQTASAVGIVALVLWSIIVMVWHYKAYRYRYMWLFILCIRLGIECGKRGISMSGDDDHGLMLHHRWLNRLARHRLASASGVVRA